jgi:hypothetical protein
MCSGDAVIVGIIAGIITIWIFVEAVYRSARLWKQPLYGADVEKQSTWAGTPLVTYGYQLGEGSMAEKTSSAS